MMRKMKLTACVPAFLFSGCITLTQFQSPQVLDKGKHEFTIGAGVGFYTRRDGSEGIWPDIFAEGRYGLGSNMDFGIRFFGLPPLGIIPLPYLGGIKGDLKYQITKNPPYISVDLGISFGVNILYKYLPINFAFYPALIFGTDRFYASARTIIIPHKAEDMGPPITLYGLSVGYSIGNKFRLTPEISILLILWGEGMGKPIYVPALGITIRS